MDHDKRQNFEESEGQVFPPFCTLGAEASAAIAKKLASFAGTADIESRRFFDTLVVRADACDVNAATGPVDLGAVARDAGIVPCEDVYALFPSEGTIDRLRFADLVGVFDWIYIPYRDDIVVFDHTIEWMIVITHDGIVGTVRTGGGPVGTG